MKATVIILLTLLCLSANGQTLLDRYKEPSGFKRILTDEWGNYLRTFPVYPENHICLDCYGHEVYDEPHEAVLRLDFIGNDLQQCADACIRLRCEYLHKYKHDDKMVFHDTQGNVIKQRPQFRKYLEHVFSLANSYSLQRYDTNPTTLDKLKIGDLLCHGGFPGHVSIIMDIAKDDKGNYALLCAQSWMPAREVEIIPASANCVWHIIEKDTKTILVGIGFHLKDLRTWKNE